MDSRGNDREGCGNERERDRNDIKNNKGVCYTPLLDKEEILK
jgi:hypothetical protein